MSDLPETADVVIVGGGSADAVLAARLSQDPADGPAAGSGSRLRAGRLPARAA